MLIVYESVRSGKRAKELCDHLGQQIAPECELNLNGRTRRSNTNQERKD
jgi:hypothetical protein